MLPMAHLPLLRCYFMCSYFFFRAALGFFVVYNFLIFNLIFFLFILQLQNLASHLLPHYSLLLLLLLFLEVWIGMKSSIE